MPVIQKYMDVPWRFIISARALFEPDHPVSQTGAIVAEDAFGNLTCVVSNVQKEIGERITADHNRRL